ncbi:MAG: hypothetical protein ACI4VF_00100 [Lachnospirales bacterium]
MADIEKILNDKAFDCFDRNVKESIKNLYLKTKGKRTEEMLPYIIQFVNSLPKGIILTKEQKNGIINAITYNMSESERKNIMTLLKLFNF